MLYAIIGMLVIIADQYIKFWVQGHIPLTSAGEEFIPGILSLVNVHNDGAAFGFLAGSGARIPFIILAGVFTVVVIIALATKLISGKLARWSIVLVTAGGLSNCVDRVFYGYVQDMFKTEFINFPVFNLADVFITLFAILFALAVIFGKTRRDEEEDYDYEEEDEEEVQPRRISRRKQKQSRRRYAEEEEDDEEEEEEPAPVRKPVKQKRGRRVVVAEEDDGEEEPAPTPVRRAAQAPAKAKKSPVKKPAPVQNADPFADWDQPAAKPAASDAPSTAPAAAKPAVKTPVAKTPAVTPVRATQSRPAPAAAERPAPRPAAKPVEEEEFSLDDILNEFR